MLPGWLPGSLPDSPKRPAGSRGHHLYHGAGWLARHENRWNMQTDSPASEFLGHVQMALDALAQVWFERIAQKPRTVRYRLPDGQTREWGPETAWPRLREACEALDRFSVDPSLLDKAAAAIAVPGVTDARQWAKRLLLEVIECGALSGFLGAVPRSHAAVLAESRCQYLLTSSLRTEVYQAYPIPPASPAGGENGEPEQGSGKPAAQKGKGGKGKKRKRQSDVFRPITPAQAEAIQVVGECKGNIAEAARRLGKDPKTVKQSYEAGLKKIGGKAVKPTTKAIATDRRGQSDVADIDDARRDIDSDESRKFRRRK